MSEISVEMSIADQIRMASKIILEKLYSLSIDEANLQINETKPEFEGDYTLVLFSFLKQLKRSPDQLGKEIGDELIKTNSNLFSGFNVIKGFLNLTVNDNYWINFLQNNYADPDFGKKKDTGKKVMVEYSSPNTNKPLHLGHLRNNFLGLSIAEILQANGADVTKTCIVNDRGIHICKSMLAWQKYANGATPQSTGIKGDHFVGDYYVRFENDLKIQAQPIIDRIKRNELSGFEGNELDDLKRWLAALQRETNKEKIEKLNDEIKEIARNHTAIMAEAKQMLRKWEAGDKEVVELWKKMNSWVYEGFNTTYKRIGSDFDKIYYESNTYLLGKDIVKEGLDKGVFYKKEDGSVWIDLTADGLDEKLVMRRDGTSVYITQDIGLAEQKFNEYKPAESIYVVGDEQNYHFKVLKLIAEKMKIPGAEGIYHLSYGMVELPTGRMKSREGTVVDADDLIDEMVSIAGKHTEELGKVKDFNAKELKELYDTIGLGALKFFLLRVDPKKRMVFNPEESIDLHGFTGPFVQYTHARIKSILRKEEAVSSPQFAVDNRQPAVNSPQSAVSSNLLKLEKGLIVKLEQYSTIVEQAAIEHNPSVIAIYAFELAKTFNTFYTEHSVMNAETEEKKQLRLHLCEMTANVIASSMGLLGIKVPERM
ncbi:MAG TPA: arginine--tRNA ligase [Chitinophagaceae bacterium]|nr:arginine--tRNA ligase [Chitinophagaceae bacterium]